jgi:hypothetical protein
LLAFKKKDDIGMKPMKNGNKRKRYFPKEWRIRINDAKEEKIYYP